MHDLFSDPLPEKEEFSCWTTLPPRFQTHLLAGYWKANEGQGPGAVQKEEKTDGAATQAF